MLRRKAFLGQVLFTQSKRHMVLCGEYHHQFPKQSATNVVIHKAHMHDLTEKKQHASKFNMSKWYGHVNIEQGD